MLASKGSGCSEFSGRFTERVLSVGVGKPGPANGIARFLF